MRFTMNAIKIADYLHDFMRNEVEYDESKHNQAQLMLRMLNAENEALKDKLNLANKQIEILGDWIK